VASIASLAAASPVPATADGQYNTGAMQCCNSVEQANSPAASNLLGLLGIEVQDATAMVGFSCSPIDVIGVANGNSCSASPVCCQDNSHGTLVSMGCVPITL
ncbi:hypothetical protein JAAARDRAFT_91644, partial [Jaapia argillacea MUCL 33604]